MHLPRIQARMRSPISFASAVLVLGSALLGSASSSAAGTGVQDVTLGTSGGDWQLEPRFGASHADAPLQAESRRVRRHEAAIELMRLEPKCTR